MVINCPKIRHMITNHPRLMARILAKLESDQAVTYWYRLCKKKPVEAMGYLVHNLIKINRGLK